MDRTFRQPSIGALPLGLTVLLLATSASVIEAADNDFSDGITVDATVDSPDASPGDGVCADSMARCTLRAAVQESNATLGVQTIQLSAATYLFTVVGAAEDTAATGDLDLTDSVIILGVGSAATVIDANGAAIGDRAFHLQDLSGLGLEVTLEDLAVVNGFVLNTNGGGIFVEAAEGEEGGGPPGLLEESLPDFGPAEILALEPVETAFSLTLRRVRVAANTADSNVLDPEGKPVGGSGGGVYAGAALIIEDSEISGNVAAANGGGFYAGGVVTLTGSVVALNTAEGGGGFFETGSHTSFYSECAIVGNTAVGGGGLTTRTQVSLQLTNCTIDGNTATDVGAGVQASGLVNLVYSTVTNNASGTASPNGGGGLNSFAGGSFRLWSTLVADNLVGTGEEEGEPADPEERNCGCTGGVGCTSMVQFLSLGHNLEDIDTCFFDDEDDLPNTPPGIGALVTLDPLAPVVPLLFGSAAVDAGDPAVCPATDQRGVARPQDGDIDSVVACDIGAYELVAALFSDGFESGDTSAWSETRTATTIDVAEESARFGDFGARFALSSTCTSENVVIVTDPSGVVEACDALTADGTVATPTTLRAGDHVVLRAGFNVDAGASLAVQIQGSLYPDSWVQDDTPASEATYATRFYLDPTALGLDAESDRFYHFIAFDALGAPVFRLGVTWNDLDEVRVFLEAIEDGGAVVSNEGIDEAVLAESGDPDCQTSPGCYQWVELAWMASSGADDGIALVCVNGVAGTDCRELIGLDTDTRRVDFVRWGVMDVNPSDGPGYLDVDQFDSYRGFPIGPSALEGSP